LAAVAFYGSAAAAFYSFQISGYFNKAFFFKAKTRATLEYLQCWAKRYTISSKIWQIEIIFYPGQAKI